MSLKKWLNIENKALATFATAATRSSIPRATVAEVAAVATISPAQPDSLGNSNEISANALDQSILEEVCSNMGISVSEVTTYLLTDDDMQDIHDGSIDRECLECSLNYWKSTGLARRYKH